MHPGSSRGKPCVLGGFVRAGKDSPTLMASVEGSLLRCVEGLLECSIEGSSDVSREAEGRCVLRPDVMSTLARWGDLQRRA